MKIHDYFQNINFNIMFLLNNILFYMQNTMQCLLCTRCIFCVYICINKFLYTYMRKWNDKKIENL